MKKGIVRDLLIDDMRRMGIEVDLSRDYTLDENGTVVYSIDQNENVVIQRPTKSKTSVVSKKPKRYVVPKDQGMSLKDIIYTVLMIAMLLGYPLYSFITYVNG